MPTTKSSDQGDPRMVWIAYDGGAAADTPAGRFRKGSALPVPAEDAPKYLANAGYHKAIAKEIERGKKEIEIDKKTMAAKEKRVAEMAKKRRQTPAPGGDE